MKNFSFPGQIILRRTLTIERLSQGADTLQQADKDKTKDD
jgi:hypothetical protein